MATFSHFQEVWTDNIVDKGGGVRECVMRLLAVFDDGTKEWRYIGTTAAEHPVSDGNPVKELPAKRFPTAFNDLAAGNVELLHDMAITAEADLLQR